jgi:hypothetical protein
MVVGCERNGVKVQGGSCWRLKLQQQEKKNQDINNSL